MKVDGHWNYLYRAVDKEERSMTFLLNTYRDQDGALATRCAGEGKLSTRTGPP